MIGFCDIDTELRVVEDSGNDDVVLDVVVDVTVDEEVVVGGKSVVNDEVFDLLEVVFEFWLDEFKLSSFAQTLASHPLVALDSCPFAVNWVALLAQGDVVTEEELKLRTELQLRIVSLSEASSEPQKALLADCDNEFDEKSIEDSLS